MTQLLYAQYTISGNVYNDPDAGIVNNSSNSFTFPIDPLQVVLINNSTGKIVTSAIVNKANGTFNLGSHPNGNYYAMLITQNVAFLPGQDAPPIVLETSWTYTGESNAADGTPDATVNGRNTFTISGASLTTIKFGIQERPFAHNKQNILINKEAVSSVALSVNTGASFSVGSAILSGSDNLGTVVSYSINVLPAYGSLYLNNIEVTSLTQVTGLTSTQANSLRYLPNPTALKHELDYFTYYVTDNANTKSNNATYTLVFDLLDADGDGVNDKADVDSDNDGITDNDECGYSSISNLQTAYGQGLFQFITPADFDLTVGYRVGINLSKDLSSKFGKPIGSIIINITNANTHPGDNVFFVNDSTGPSQWAITGTLGAYALLEQGLSYFSYDTRSISNLKPATDAVLFAQNSMPTDQPIKPGWTRGNDGYTWWLRNGNPVTNPASEGALALALTSPDEKYFQFSATSNNRDEWSTYFVRLLPECDDDNDGIPNRLDLDSDNDGCLDAYEGSASYTSADIETAGGTVSTGTSLANQNLCGGPTCIDPNGAPAAGLQSNVSAYDPSEISDQCGTVLPLKLIDFNVSKIDGDVQLNWNTEQEVNTKGFYVERSANSTEWRSLGYVNAYNKQGKNSYSYIDYSPAAGTYFYRLKMIDMNGSFEHSKTVEVAINSNGLITVYPNPVTNKAFVSGITFNSNIVLTNADGKVLKLIKNYNANILELDMSVLNSGLYIITVTGNNGSTFTTKVIKQ